MIDFIDKTNEQNGTPINRENLMAVQGFMRKDTDINQDEDGNYTVKEINPHNGHRLITTITENSDGSIVVVETFDGEKIITKTTTINAEMNAVSEVIK